MKPETVLVVFTRASDCRKGPGMSVMVFVTKSFLPRGGIEFEREPTKENIEFEIAKGGFKCTSWRIVESVPEDRTFRNAWRDNGTEIVHDIAHCREIHRQHLRKARAPLLAALDVEYQRADEDGDAERKAQVVARKRMLRDVTAHPEIEAAETPEQLKTCWPIGPEVEWRKQ